MKILFLSQRFLLPMDTGGKIRTGKILEQLKKSHEITLVSNVEYAKDGPYLARIDSLCSKFVPVAWREVKKYSPLFFIRLFFQMFSIYPVNVLNDYSKPLRLAVEKEVATGAYDVAICDFVQSALVFRNVGSMPAVLFQHNVESMIARRHIGRNRNPLAKLFWWLQWKKMLRFEKKACGDFKTVISVSETDRDLFGRLYDARNVDAIPTGVDVAYYAPQKERPVTENSLVFCGSMDWLPNEDAMVYFITGILPKIKEKIPDVSLTVVGRNPSPALRRIVEGFSEVTLTGWVDDTRPHIAAGAVFVVPIRIGGGTRMKIYEAMAMGKAVVSTPVGAEGLPVRNEENILIEDDPQGFAERTIALLSDCRRREAIGLNAHLYVNDHFGWDSVAELFGGICRQAAA